MSKTLKIAVVGLGARGVGLLKLVIYNQKDIEVVAVCDTYEDRVKDMQALAKLKLRKEPRGYVDYKEIIEKEKDLDAVVIATSWEVHTNIAIDFMNAKIPVGIEVGGAYDINECYRILECYEKTKTPYMMLENCCYGELELSTLKMVQEGLFGDVVHCKGGYKHDLRDEIAFGKTNRHYRLEEYKKRNAEIYPTHSIGPISKILNITYGNKFDTLSSFASPSLGLKNYVATRKDKYPEIAYLENVKFTQGDIITTVITCANGETIELELDTTLPRHYSRGWEVRGTKATVTEELKKLYIDTDAKMRVKTKSLFYMKKKYPHRIWKWYRRKGVRGGHGGMDYLVLNAFFDAVRKGDGYMPIDVYESLTWMVVTALSAASIKEGGKPQEFPDFTKGAWKTRKQQGSGFYFLEK
ncbi:MAG: Gfo/Idh/MocA family protein [Christensenellales bacterium]|jgi:predicted dehydrogenase|nr:Gfo/Idh/MocA family oxidoreductase [Clostridiales bacterium]